MKHITLSLISTILSVIVLVMGIVGLFLGSFSRTSIILAIIGVLLFASNFIMDKRKKK